jgi:hypothetical protein
LKIRTNPATTAQTGRVLDVSIIGAALVASVLLVTLYLVPLALTLGAGEVTVPRAPRAAPAGPGRSHAGFLGAMTGATLLESASPATACTAAFDSLASDAGGWPALLDAGDREEFLRSCSVAVNGN